METYKVINNQNIFDVAIDIYGSIEGIFDLLINNPDLSFDSKLYDGQTLLWDKDFVINSSIVSSLHTDNAIPINGERNVYYKNIEADLKCVIQMGESASDISLNLSGDGKMIIDWGDNSEIQTIQLQPTLQLYQHYFDNEADVRTIRLYGDFNIKTWDMSTIHGLVLPTQPIIVDEVIISKNIVPLHGLFLFNGIYYVKINDIPITDLSPIKNMSLSYLELKGISYSSEDVLNDYLKYLAKHNNQRRNCNVVIDTQPSGEYKEPDKDENGSYLITSGMEAIYVITHEAAWNESGPWIFNINGTIYQYNNAV